MAARWSPSPPTSARARSWSRRAPRRVLLGIKPENIFIEDLREEFVRDYVFPMFRANTVYEGPVSARHLDRAAADRQEADRDRREGRRRRGGCTAPPARATTRSASSSTYYAPKPDITIIAPWREWDLRSRDTADRLRRKASDPDRQGQARRRAVLGRRQPAARVIRRQGAGRPAAGSAGLRLFAHRRSRRRRRTSRPIITIDFEKGDAVAHRRQDDVARDAAHRAQRSRQAGTASADSISSKTVSSA